jgi:hypothetical protein
LEYYFLATGKRAGWPRGFSTLIDEGYLNKVMDENGNSIENFGFLGGWQNNIGNLKPGKGYRVNVTTNCSLIIN